MTKKPDTIESYIAKRTAPVQRTLQSCRTLVLKTLPQSTEDMKWGAPAFFNGSGTPVIYIYGGKDHVNLGFVDGVHLKDPGKLLKGSGKSGRHLKIFPNKPAASEKELIELIKQCGS